MLLVWQRGGLNIASRSLSRLGIFEEAVLLIADPSGQFIALAFEWFEDGVDDQYFVVDSFSLDSNPSSISSWCWENDVFYSSANCFPVTKHNGLTSASVYPLLVDDVFYNTRFLKLDSDYPIGSGGGSQCPDGANCFTDGNHTHIIHPDYRCSNNQCWDNNNGDTETNCWDGTAWYEIYNGDVTNVVRIRDRSMCEEVYSSGIPYVPPAVTVIDPGTSDGGGMNDMKIKTVNMSKGSKSTRHSTLYQDPGEDFYAYAKLDNDGTATAYDFKLKFYIDGGKRNTDGDDEDLETYKFLLNINA